MNERRSGPRVKLDIFLNELVGERLHRARAEDINEEGILLHRVTGHNHQGVVQLEFSLPGVSEPIWALGEVVRQAGGVELLESMALRFLAMAKGHRKMIRHFVKCQRKNTLMSAVGTWFRSREDQGR